MESGWHSELEDGECAEQLSFRRGNRPFDGERIESSASESSFSNSSTHIA